MFDKTFTHDTFRKLAAVFGNLFNSMRVYRKDKDGNVVQAITVPIEYGPRRKTLMRILNDEKLDRPAVILPRMSFEFTGFRRASERQISKLNTRLDRADNDGLVKQYQPVPYDVNIRLYIYSKMAYDSFQLIERITPNFQPEWNVSVVMTDMKKIDNIKFVLNSVSQVDDYEGDIDTRRFLVWALDFTASMHFYPDVSAAGVIKKVILSFFPVPGSGEITAEEMDRTPPSDRYTLTPGLTTDGLPTSDPALTVPYQQINAEDDYGFIEQWEDFTTGNVNYTPHTYVREGVSPTGDKQTIIVKAPSNYLPIQGGALGGYLTLHDDPEQANHPVTLQYLQDESVNKDIIRVQTLTANTGTVNINLDNGQYVIITMAHNVSQINIIGWTPNVISKCTIDLRYEGNFTITNWGTILWSDNGDAPNLTSLNNTRDVIGLYSPDGGSTVFGNIVGLNYKVNAG